jgi:hypothetical protein
MRNYNYPGGKGLAGITQWLIGMMPTHSRYVEPFAGKAALLRNKPPALSSLLIDLDRDTIAWLRELAWPGAIVKRGDGIRWLEQKAGELDADTLVYCDPPYLHSTRKKLALYKHEMSRGDHERLLASLVQLRCRVMLSGYASPLYDRQLRGWHRETHAAITRGRTMATEVVWCNFAPAAVPPASPVEYSALGDDYRQRERVARKLRRWGEKLQALPERERAALLANLIHAHQVESRRLTP